MATRERLLGSTVAVMFELVVQPPAMTDRDGNGLGLGAWRLCHDVSC